MFFSHFMWFLGIYTHAFFLTSPPPPPLPPPHKHPLLLVPGLGGSRLKWKNDLDIFPPNVFHFLFQRNQWQTHMLNEKDVQPMSFGDASSLDIRSVIPFCMKRNYFDYFLHKQNTFAIPYDFRFIHQSHYLTTFFEKLKIYIESFGEPVVLLAHSTGGLLIHWFLCNQSKKWKNKHIQSVINVNVPFGGLFVGLKHFIQTTFLNVLFGKNTLKNIGGFIINMPNTNIFQTILTMDGIKHPDFYDFFHLTNIKQQYEKNMKMMKSFCTSNGVKKTHIIYCSNIATLSGFSKIRNKKYTLVFEEGDGVVPLKSLLVPNIWECHDKEEKVFFYHVRNYSHSNLLFSKEFEKLVEEIMISP